MLCLKLIIHFATDLRFDRRQITKHFGQHGLDKLTMDLS